MNEEIKLSYADIVSDNGSLREYEDVFKKLETASTYDKCMTIEQMYGMIWYLARNLINPDAVIKTAALRYREGLEESPTQRYKYASNVLPEVRELLSKISELEEQNKQLAKENDKLKKSKDIKIWEVVVPNDLDDFIDDRSTLTRITENKWYLSIAHGDDVTGNDLTKDNLIRLCDVIQTELSLVSE